MHFRRKVEVGEGGRNRPSGVGGRECKLPFLVLVLKEENLDRGAAVVFAIDKKIIKEGQKEDLLKRVKEYR